MPQLRLADCLLHYDERGNGPPLLLLMGLGGSSRSWGEPFLRALESRFRVIALDHRGSGRSTRGSAPYSIPLLADDAAAALAGLGLQRAHVFGLSLGGMVAQELVLRHAASVDGLVLASTTCGGTHAAWPDAAARGAFAEGLTRGEALWPLVVTRAFAAANRPFLNRVAWETLTAGTPPSVLREQAGSIARFATYERLPSVQTPTLVMIGDRDRLIQPENGRILARRIPGAQGAVVRDTGHVFVWEAPERAAAEVVRFLSGVSRPQPAAAAP
jgi:3-oxoadipate enol-lactonase